VPTEVRTFLAGFSFNRREALPNSRTLWLDGEQLARANGARQLFDVFGQGG